MPFEPRRPLARQPQATPYTAQFAANQGLAGAANQMQSLNQQIAARGPVPYQPAPASPGQPAPSPYSPAMQQMVNRGLNNARFGNARESMLYDISHPGNGYRPPVEPRGGSVTQVYPRPNATPFTPPDPAEFAKRQGLEFNPQTGVLAGNSQAAGMNARQLGNLRAGVNPFAPKASPSQLAQNLKNTQANRALAAKDRASRPTPFQQRDAMRQKAFENQLAAAAPEQYQNRLALEAQQKGIASRTSEAGRMELAGKLAAAGYTPEQVQQSLSQFGGGNTPFSPKNPIAAGSSLPPSEHSKVREIAAESPAKAEQHLIGLGVPKEQRQKIMAEITEDPLYGVPFMDRPLTPPRGMRPGMTVREGLGAITNPFEAATRGAPDQTPPVTPRGALDSISPFLPLPFRGRRK